MRVAVVGGGIVGLFTAWHLQKEGVDVTLFEEGTLGAGSVHAAGIIEPTTAYRTNTFSFLRRVWRFWKIGTCTFRRVDASWLVESLRQMERTPLDGAEDSLRELSKSSVARYKALAEERNDFAYIELGLTELFDDPAHFAEERTLALSQRSVIPVEVREEEETRRGPVLPRCQLAPHRTVRREDDEGADEDHGSASAGPPSRARRHRLHGQGDSPIRCRRCLHRCRAARKLGVPLTGVRGYGWHVRTHGKVGIATVFVDRGIAVVPFADEVKVTGGWDFDLYDAPVPFPQCAGRGRDEWSRSIRSLTSRRGHDRARAGRAADDRQEGAGGGRLPEGFRLGWSFAPGMGRHAALLCLDRTRNDPFFARFCTSLHSGRL